MGISSKKTYKQTKLVGLPKIWNRMYWIFISNNKNYKNDIFNSYKI